MKKLSIRLQSIIFFCITATSLLQSQVVKVIDDTTVVNTDVTWYGINIPRNTATSLTFSNSQVTSQNTVGYILQAGDENPNITNNNLDGAIISGNKFVWNGDKTASTITHGIFTGYNINVTVKYNYVDVVPMGLVRKSNGMTDVSGVVAYNIFRSPEATAIAIKGINGIKVYGNTFYSSNVPYTAPGAGTWRGLVDVYENDSPVAISTGTKIKNNIFYTKYQIYNIYVYETSCLEGFESDYNVFYCEDGTPVFRIGSTTYTFSQWQALGYDLHSVVVNPNFTDTINFAPSSRLNYGTDLGASLNQGLSADAIWGSGIPQLTEQSGTWQVGAVVLGESTYFISPGGNDTSGDGSFASPWFTINKAWTSASAGDIIYCRGGTYEYDDDQVMSGKSGTAGNMINVWAYPGENPVFTRAGGEFGAVSWPVGLLKVSGANYVYLRDLRITGFEQDTALASICSGLTLYNSDNCIIERIESDHNGHGILVYECANPQILYCDTHHNYDPIDPFGSNPYGDGDGLEVTDMGQGTQTIIRGHRSWNNSDDGIDLWDSQMSVTIDSCWTWNNGYREDGVTTGGDGNGIKLGRLGSDITKLTQTLRLVTNNLSFYNRQTGINENDTKCRIRLFNNTVYANGDKGFIFFNLGGGIHTAKNNISFSNPTGDSPFTTGSDVTNNTFLISGATNTAYSPSNADFVSIDSTGVSGPRIGNKKPNITFLHLVDGSDFIEGGIDVGINYAGSAPDLGAFEYVPIIPIISGDGAFGKNRLGVQLKDKNGNPIRMQ